ncbi:MAG TPA: acylphosphatase, partial [Burkholderiaceae bacterium]
MTDHDPIRQATWHAVVRGRVQGVGFREACVAEARALGVAGWVRNRPDGSVEVVLQGPPGR